MKTKQVRTYRCKKCNGLLEGEFQKLKYCPRCLPDEWKKLKRRVIVSSIAGIFIAALIIWGYYYARNHHFVSTETGYKGDIFVPTFWGYLAFNAKTFTRVMNYSAGLKAFLVFFFFCTPFSSFVKIEYQTYRHKAEQELYRIGSFEGKLAASSNNQRMDDAGMFLMALFISAVSGPFFFVYRFYKLFQIAKFMKTAGGAVG